MTAQKSRIHDKALALAAGRARVTRLEEEKKIAGDNLKLAKSELDQIIRETCEAALDEKAGVQSLFDQSFPRE